MQCIPCTSDEEVVLKASERLQALFDQYHGKDILLLASGGTALQLMHYYEIGGSTKFAIGILDERWSTDPDQNNFLKLKLTELYKYFDEHDFSVLESVPQQGEGRDDFAKRVERQLRNWRIAHPDGIIIATMGMGPDGHTAGVFPYPEDTEQFKILFEGESWVVSYDATGKHEMPHRVSTTLTFMREQINHAVAVIYGAEKQEAFDCLMADEGALSETPSRIMHEMSDVHIFTTLNT